MVKNSVSQSSFASHKPRGSRLLRAGLHCMTLSLVSTLISIGFLFIRVRSIAGNVPPRIARTLEIEQHPTLVLSWLLLSILFGFLLFLIGFVHSKSLRSANMIEFSPLLYGVSFAVFVMYAPLLLHLLF